MKKKRLIKLLILTGIIGLALVGEVKCVYKVVECNWAPVGKAEVIYTIAAATGFGAIVGWVDIKDE